MRAFNTGDFQELVYPDGSAAQRRRRRSGVMWMEASASERMLADTVVAYLETKGVKANRGEGDMYFEGDEATLARAIGPHLSPAGRDLAQLLVREQRSPTGADASILLTWDELAERVAQSERFVTMNPSAPGRQEIAQWHRNYLRLFLAGSDNTEVFHRRTGVLDPEVRSRLERYVLSNGGTESGRTVSQYLDLLKKTGYKRTAAVTSFLRAIERR